MKNMYTFPATAELTKFVTRLLACCMILLGLTVSAVQAQSCSGPPASAGSVTATPASVCFGGSSSLAAAGASNDAGIVYQWYSSGTAGGPYSAVAAATDTVLGTGALNFTTYYVLSVKCSATGDSILSAETTVTVLPSAVVINGSAAFCTGGSTTLTASATPAAVSYAWSNAETGASISVSTAGSYSVTTTDANGCTASASVSVVEADFPVVGTISGSSTVCYGASTALSVSATVGTGTLSYSWALNGNPIPASNSSTYNATAPGSYTVTVTSSAGCSTTSSAFAVSYDSTPLSGTYTLGGAASCSTFTTINAFALAISNNGMSGPVVLEVPAGHTETTPVGGIVLSQCGLASGLRSSATNTLTIQKTGSGSNPLITGAAGVDTSDAIVWIEGMDYVTIDGINLQGSLSTITVNQHEYGYALVRCNGTDGAQNNTIKNCSISLNRNNVVSSGIFSASVNRNSVAVIPTSVEGANSNNAFYSNTISNSYFGIFLSGYNDLVAPYAFYDQNNTIGASGQGNTITSFGNSSAAATAVCAAIYTEYNNATQIRYNTIAGSGHTGLVTGIYIGNARWASVDVTNNTLTATSAATSGAAHIYNIYVTGGTRLSRTDAVTNTINISNNSVQNCAVPSASAGRFWAIGITTPVTDSLSAHTINVNANSVTGNTNSSTTASDGFAMMGVVFQRAANQVNITNNIFTNNQLAGGSGAGNRMIVTGSPGNTPLWTCTWNISNNTLTNNGVSAAGGLMTGIAMENYAGNSMLSGGITISGNTITGVTQTTASATGAFSGILCTANFNVPASAASIPATITNNTVSSIVRTASTTGAFTGISCIGVPTVLTITGNQVINNSIGGTATGTTGVFTGITGPTTNGAFIPTSNISNNTVTGNTHNGTGSSTLINGGAGLALTVSNNTVGNHAKTTISASTTSATITGITTTAAQATNYTISGNSVENMRILGITGNSTANTINGILASASVLSETVTNNTVKTLYTAGTASGYTAVIFGIRAPGSASADRVIRGNLVGNLYNTGGNGTIRAIRSEAGFNVAISKNKIYDIYPGRPSSAASATSVSVGISISSGSIHNVFNNIIGLDFALISVPTYTGNNAVMGIEVANSTATHEVNLRFNTIRMSGNPGSGATFGSSGIAVTSTTPPVVELSNNLVQNMLTGGGTSPGFAVAYRRANVLSAANYSDRSNNNLFYAGTPGAAQLIYFDGTNSDQTLADYKTRAGALSPARDQASVSEAVTFLNTTTGTNANYLHIDPAVATLVEGGGKPIASVLDDYDGDVRSTGGPDIGADEGNFLGIQPAFASVAASPATGQCTAVDHTINVTTINGALPITGVLLNYSYNGVLAGSNPMTSTGANTWTGTIPAATPVNATVTWNVIATDGVYSPTFVGASYKDAYLTGVTVPVNATPASYCDGGSSVLLAGTPGGNATIGTGTTANTASGYPTMFGNYWYQEWHQVVYSAAELAAAGLVKGNISAIKFNLNSPANPAGVPDYTVRMGAAPSEFVTAFQTTGLTTVFGGPGTTYTTAAGVNNINLSTPYYWDGTSNLLVDVRVSGAYGAANAITVNSVKSTGTSVVFAYSSSSNPNFWTSNPAPTLSFSRPNITIVGNTSLPGFTVSWSDGTSTVGSGNPITVSPTTTTTYTATLTDGNGCTVVSAPGILTVNPIPAAPTAAPSTQCGTGIPGIKVSGGTAYNWYLASSGGSPIQSSTSDSLTSYSISTTTTFYVSNIDPITNCESGRTAVVATVNQPDAIAASNNTGGTPICPGASVILSVSQTGNTNNYSLSWSGDGATGLTGNSVTIAAPAAGGTYTYTVNAVDGTCNATATTSITVIAPPAINNITANPSTPVCAGSSVTLTAVTGLVPSSSPTAYSFAQSAGAFTPLAGGTNSTASGDDGTELNVPIGFNFTYNGTASTTIGICTNGLLSFGTFPASNWVNNLASNALILGPMWDDNNRSTGTISYLTTGTAPNRVFTVEWNQIAIGGGGSSANPKGTFQVKLFEGSNVIEYVYGPISPMTSVSASIGVSGAAGSFISVTPGAPATASTSAENTAINAATFLTSGTTYTFTPPAQPGPGSFTWSWDNGAGSGNVVTVTPPSTTTYTVTATDPASGCTSDTSITVVINQLPPAPVATNSTQCGAGVPTASVASASSDVAPIFNWYTSASGGSPVQSGTSTTLLSYLVTSSTNLYVSETSSTTGCEGPRSQVDITVIQPDSVATSVSAGPYCLGGSITLTATNTGSSNSYAYTWSSSAGSGISGSVSGATAVVTPTVAGTYTYTMSAVDGLCNYVATQTVTVSDIPSITAATASPAGPVCAGSAVTLTATTLSSGPQTAPTGYCGSGATSTFDTKIDAVTIGTLSNSSSPSVCETYSNFTATVPAPTLEAGQTYSASVTHGSCGGFYGGYSKMWIDFNRNGIFEEPAELVLSGDHSSGFGSVVSGNVTIPSTALAGVTRMRVMLNENGSPTMLPCGTFTYGETEDYNVNILAQGAGTYTWSWDNGAGTGNSVTVNPTVSTTYTVTATNAGGCTSTASVSVTALPLPSTPTAVNNSRCGFGPANVSVSSNTGAATPLYVWYTQASGGSPIPSQSGSSLVAYNVTTTTSFWVSEFDGTCESARTEVVQTVVQPDAVTATASSNSLCLGESFTLSAVQTGSTNVYTLAWTASPDPGSGLPTGSSATSQSITPTTPGTYVYTIDAVDGQCAYQSSVTVTVNANPTKPDLGADQTVCEGTSLSFTAFANTLVGGGIQSAASFTGDDEIFNFTLNGTSLNNSSTCATLAPGAGSLQQQYSNYTTSVPAPTLVPGNSYTGSITIGQCSGVAYSCGFAVFIDLNRNGLFDVPAERVAAGPSLTAAVAGTVFPFSFTMPSTVAPGLARMRVIAQEGADGTTGGIPPNGPYGWGETEDYTVRLDYNPGASYQWSSIPAGFSSTNTSITTGPVLTTTSYVVTVTSPSGCTTADTVVVNAISTPDAPLYTTTADSICISGTVSFQVTNIQLGVSYQWQSAPSATGPWTDVFGATATNFTTPNLAPVLGDSTAYYRVISSCGANSTASTEKSIFVSRPSINAVTDVTRCGPGQVTLNATGNGTIEWYDVPTGGTALATGGTYAPTVLGSTSYYVGAAIGNCRTITRQTLNVTILAAPGIAASASPAAICEGGSSTISVSSSNANYTYVWDGTTSGSSLTVTPATTTTYTVQASDATTGCSAITNVTVTVNLVPVISSVSSTPAAACPGQSFQLEAVAIASGPQNEPQGYCADGGSVFTTADEQIFGVSFGSMSNLSQGETCASNYTNYTTTVPTLTINAGSTYPFSVVTDECDGPTYFASGVSIFIDYNRDGDWDDVGELAYTTSTTTLAPNTQSGSITIPLTATLGVTRMRVKVQESVASPLPCSNFSYGEAEDYLVNIVGPSASYSWSPAATLSSSSIANPTSSGITATTTFTVTATSLAGCTSSPASVTVALANAPSPVITTPDTNLCNSEIYVQVADNGPYAGTGYPAGTVFTWKDASGGTYFSAADADSISSLFGNSFFVTVNVPGGCVGTSDTAYVVTKAVTVVENISNASCAGGDGSIVASISSGLPPFNYVWSTDAAGTNVVRNVTTSATADTLSNLSAGTYYLVVTDEVGAPASCGSGLLTFTVAGSTAITATVTGTDITCNAAGDGSATVTYTGGAGTINILWNDGSTDVSRVIATGGTYTVTVSDNFGCSDVATVTIVEPAALAVTLSTTQASAPGATDGTASAVVTGGTAPISIEWFDETLNPAGTGASVSGLAAGLYYVLITDANNCQLIETVTVTEITDITFNVTAIFEGFHDGLGGMIPVLSNAGVGISATEVDTIRVELRDAISPTTTVATASAVISTTGDAQLTFPGAVAGGSYYVAVFHRNAVQTWSALPVTMANNGSYDFTSASSQAYFDNMVEVTTGVWAFFSGDVEPQDEVVDILDQGNIDNDSFNFVGGYVATDINGDGVVDILDQGIVDNNAFNFIGSAHP